MIWFLPFLLGSLISSAVSTTVYVDQSINDMVESMDLPSKVGQMVQIDISYFMISGTSQVNYTLMENYIKKYQVGSLLNSPFSGGPINGVTGWTATEWRDLMVQVQTFVNETEYKIPVIYGIDSIHGATFVKDAALMPQALNLAATFDVSLAQQAGKVTSKDTRAAGIPWIFAPVLGLGLQPLWARFAETFGEDPYLAAQMGSSMIKGLQYEFNDGSLPQQTAACMKHFIAYSIPVDGHDRSPVQLPDRILRQLYIPSFQASIEAGVLTGMESYQEVGGVPMVSSTDYLTTLLRKEMNFTGFLVTDYAEIENLHNWHKVAATQRDAVKIAMLDTTIDMSMVPLDTSFFDYLMELVTSGEVNVSRVDESVKRILQVKKTLGLLDNPNLVLNDPLVDTVGQDSDWEVSLNASRSSITVVKNSENILPLSKDSKVFLTGPTCNSSISQTGGWSIHWQGVYYEYEQAKRQTVLTGMQTLWSSTDNIQFYEGPALDATDLSEVNMTLAINLANEADFIVICLGEGTYAEKPGDIDDLALAQGQIDYVVALAEATSKPIVTVMIAGRPRLFHDAVESSNAVVLGYQPGPVGGQAIAEVLAGEFSPSGRLPFSYPRHEADIMYPYHHKYNDQCTVSTGPHSAAYIFCEVEWPFGTGYGYSDIKYSGLTISAKDIDESDTLTVSLSVTNTGNEYTVKHSVLLFLYDLYRRVTPEYKLLKRFELLTLVPQETKTVNFTLTSNDFQYVGIDSRYVLESGEYIIGMSPYVDCRSENTTLWSINALDTTSSGESMCKSFTMTLSSTYQPICDAGCNMWQASKGGICGQSVAYDSCMSTCTAEAWTWDYVDCITNYYQDETCTDINSMQCFDAFDMMSIHHSSVANDDDDHEEYSLSFVLLIGFFAGIFGIVVGSALTYSYSHFICCEPIKNRLHSTQTKDINNPLVNLSVTHDEEKR